MRSAALRWILLLIIVGAASSCQKRRDRTRAASGSARPYVVTTTAMIADVARRVGAEDIRVESLMPSGVDPHLYKASAGDVGRLGSADAILYNGLHLEGKMQQLLAKLGRRGRLVVAVAEVIPKAERRQPPRYRGADDPHVWFDVRLWAQTITPVESTLARLAPAKARVFSRRAAALKREMIALDAWVAAQVERIPKARRVLVTAHDAFGYFGRRYGMEVVGLQGLSTVSRAGIHDVDRVAALIVARKVGAIFVESSVPRRTIEAVKQASRAKGQAVTIGGELFSDSMGAPGTVEGRYPGMVRHNVRTIVEALR